MYRKFFRIYTNAVYALGLIVFGYGICHYTMEIKTSSILKEQRKMIYNQNALIKELIHHDEQYHNCDAPCMDGDLYWNVKYGQDTLKNVIVDYYDLSSEEGIQYFLNFLP